MPITTENKYSQEIHPWNYYIPDGATKLFVGTFPTDERNGKHNFFYCSSTVADTACKTKADISKIVLLLKKYGFKRKEVEELILNKLKENANH